MEDEILIKCNALSTETEAIKTSVLGMVAENRQRDIESKPMAYNGADFENEAARLHNLSIMMLKLINGDSDE